MSSSILLNTDRNMIQVIDGGANNYNNANRQQPQVIVPVPLEQSFSVSSLHRDSDDAPPTRGRKSEPIMRSSVQSNNNRTNGYYPTTATASTTSPSSMANTTTANNNNTAKTNTTTSPRNSVGSDTTRHSYATDVLETRGRRSANYSSPQSWRPTPLTQTGSDMTQNELYQLRVKYQAQSRELDDTKRELTQVKDQLYSATLELTRIEASKDTFEFRADDEASRIKMMHLLDPMLVRLTQELKQAISESQSRAIAEQIRDRENELRPLYARMAGQSSHVGNGMNEDVEVLLLEKAELSAQAQKTGEILEDSRREINRLGTELSMAKEQLRQLKIERQQMSTELEHSKQLQRGGGGAGMQEQLQRQLDAAIAEAHSLRRDARLRDEEAQQRIEKLENRILSLEKEYDAKLTQAQEHILSARREAHGQGHAHLVEVCTQLRKELSQSKESHAKLQEAMQQQELQFQSERTALQLSHQHQLSSLEDRIRRDSTDKDQGYRDLQIAHKKSEKDLEVLRTEYAQRIKELEACVQRVTKERDDIVIEMEAQRSEHQSEKQRLQWAVEDKNNLLEAELRKRQGLDQSTETMAKLAVEEREAVIHTLKCRVSELDQAVFQASQDTATVAAERDSYKMQLATTTQQSEEMRSVVSNLRAQLEEVQRSQQTSLQHSQLTVNEARDRERQVREEMEAEHRKLLAQLRNQSEENSKIVRERDAEIQRLRREVSQKSEQITALELSGLTLQQTIASTSDDHRAAFEAIQMRLQEKERQVTSLEGELTRLRAEADRDKKRMQEKERQVAALEAELARLRAELDSHAKSLARLNEERDQAVSDATQQHSHAAKAMAQVTQLTQDCQRLAMEVQQRDENVRNLQSQLELTAAQLQQAMTVSSSEVESIRHDAATSKATLAELESTLARLQAEASRFELIRRRMHNMIQELKGNIRVFIRVRPLFASIPQGAQMPLKVLDGYTEIGQQQVDVMVTSEMVNRKQNVGDKPRTFSFKFDRIFQGSDQGEVFAEISQLVQSALDGYRVCIFAYGQTGSGKTFTMEGQAQTRPEAAGVIPRSVDKIFGCCQELGAKGWRFELKCSFLEIYNDEIRDLLTGADRLQIKQVDGKTVVANLQVVAVEDSRQVLGLLAKANQNRATASTKMNDRSSRSHSVFQLHIEGSCANSGEAISGMLNLIDLAGSERLSKSESQGDRLREAQSINASLHALADVITSIANKEPHVPYRNSKLTYLLQDSLGGDCKMLMFANIAPEPIHVGETLCSLRFADKVNKTHIGIAQSSAKVNLSRALEDAGDDIY